MLLNAPQAEDLPYEGQMVNHLPHQFFVPKSRTKQNKMRIRTKCLKYCMLPEELLLPK